MFADIGRALAGGVLAMALGAIGPTAAESNEPAARAELRNRIKAGKINTCITDSVIEHATEPVLVFQNHCDFPVHVTLCAKSAEQPRLYFFLAVRAHADARHRLWIREGEHYSYMYNSCEKPYCMPPKPQC